MRFNRGTCLYKKYNVERFDALNEINCKNSDNCVFRSTEGNNKLTYNVEMQNEDFCDQSDLRQLKRSHSK